MKITIVQGAFLPIPAVRGGAVEKIWSRLGVAFAEAGHTVTHISRSYHGLPREEVISGVRHVRVSGFDFQRFFVLNKLLDLIYSLRVISLLPSADILVTNTFWLPFLVRTRRYGHTYVHVARFPKGQIRLYHHAARLQAVSNSVAKAIVSECPEMAHRVKVIPYFVDQAQSRDELMDLQQDEHIRMLYVGRIHPEKGIELMLQAITILAARTTGDWSLAIVGPHATNEGGGGERYLRKLKEQYSAVSNRIKWIPPVYDPLELQSHYSRAHIFIYPSLAETGEAFGLAPLEAMSRGCVPVVSMLECFRDFIEDGTDGFYFDNRGARAEENLAAKLLELAGSPNTVRDVSLRALEKASKFSLEKIAQQFLQDFAALQNQLEGT